MFCRQVIGAAAILALVGGCRSGSKSNPTPAPSASFRIELLPSGVVPAPSATAPAPILSASSSAVPTTLLPDGGRIAPSGGNWLKCYANFQPRNRPEIDVERLGLMCGPSNGLKKQAHTDGEVTSGEREHRFQAEPGDCFRIFAVGAPSIEDLDVEVFDPQKTKIAFDTSDDRWPIVKPDGPFCAFEAGEYRAVVRAQRGQGRYSIEIWRLR